MFGNTPDASCLTENPATCPKHIGKTEWSRDSHSHMGVLLEGCSGKRVIRKLDRYATFNKSSTLNQDKHITLETLITHKPVCLPRATPNAPGDGENVFG